MSCYSSLVLLSSLFYSFVIICFPPLFSSSCFVVLVLLFLPSSSSSSSFSSHCFFFLPLSPLLSSCFLSSFPRLFFFFFSFFLLSLLPCLSPSPLPYSSDPPPPLIAILASFRPLSPRLLLCFFLISFLFSFSRPPFRFPAFLLSLVKKPWEKQDRCLCIWQ